MSSPTSSRPKLKTQQIDAQALYAWLEEMQWLVLECGTSWENWGILTESTQDRDLWDFNHNHFIVNVCDHYRFFITIQLSKLVSPSPNQDHSFYYLFDSILNHDLHCSLGAILDRHTTILAQEPRLATLLWYRSNYQSHVNDLLTELEAPRHSAIFRRLSTLRDKLYAHTDRRVRPESVDLATKQDLKNILDLVTDMIGKVRAGFGLSAYSDNAIGNIDPHELRRAWKTYRNWRRIRPDHPELRDQLDG